MMGDQLYADQVNDTIKDLVAAREIHSNGPVEVLEDFEEYCIGYWDASGRRGSACRGCGGGR
jgi:hypothetical protein